MAGMHAHMGHAREQTNGGYNVLPCFAAHMGASSGTMWILFDKCIMYIYTPRKNGTAVLAELPHCHNTVCNMPQYCCLLRL